MMRNARHWKVTHPTDSATTSETLEPSAIVVLLGWWGAKPHHLDKYAGLYGEILPGVITVAGTADSSAVLTMDTAKLREHAQDALDTISHLLDQEQPQNIPRPPLPIIIHIFSNGGGFVWQQMLKLLNEDSTATEDSRIRHRICAHVVDSCPAYPTWTTAVAALEGSGIAAKGGILLVGLMKAVFFLMYSVEIGWNMILGRPNRLLVYWNELMNSQWRIPQGFIYSSIDKMVDPVHLEDFIRNRRLQSEEVSVLRFDDSPHVQHFRVHPQEYQDFVKTFVDRSLAQYRSKHESKIRNH